jgi:4,5-dihydroxyphthalate decarboxylase
MANNTVTLTAMLGNYSNTVALKRNEIKSNLVGFDFVDVKVANNFFKNVVRDAMFDVSELAIVTYLQAKAYGKPYVLLPAVIVGRGQHHTIAYNAERGHLTPADLVGRRVGIRAYSVTTGVWVRGILSSDYGVDPNQVHWISFEDPHVSEYRDPANVQRAPDGKTMVQMLLDGELDAAVVGDHLPDPRLSHLIPNAENAEIKWAQTHGGVPINHMVVVRDTIARSQPEVVKEVYRMLYDSKLAAMGSVKATPPDPLRFGIEENRKMLEVIIQYSFRQGLIPRRFSVDELFDDTSYFLGI